MRRRSRLLFLCLGLDREALDACHELGLRLWVRQAYLVGQLAWQSNRNVVDEKTVVVRRHHHCSVC